MRDRQNLPFGFNGAAARAGAESATCTLANAQAQRFDWLLRFNGARRPRGRGVSSPQLMHDPQWQCAASTGPRPRGRGVNLPCIDA